MEHRAGAAVPAPGADPARPGHGGERVHDGVRQPGRRLGHRGLLHPRPGDGQAGRLRRLPAQRPGRGRRRRHPQHPVAGRPGRARTRRSYAAAARGSCAAWRPTTATCATSSSPSSAASCGCCRPGSASAPPAAAFRIATQLVDEQLITLDEALDRVTGAQLAQLMFPQFDTGGGADAADAGHGGLPGRGRGGGGLRLGHGGRAGSAAGEPVVLVRRETNPDDLEGMIAANGVLTSRGGKTSATPRWSPAAWARPCVCGAEALDVDVRSRRGSPRRADVVIDEGDVHRPSTARPARCSWARCRWCPRRWCDYLEAGPRRRALADGRTRRPPTWSAPSTGCSPTPTRSAGCGCGPTPTPPRTPPGPAGWARRASGCAAPSTCSSATGGR